MTHLNHLMLLIKTFMHLITFILAEQANNLTIGVTDSDPQSTTPLSLNEIKSCAKSDKELDLGSRTPFQCGEIGRYLVVFMNKRYVLTLCEVFVYAGNIHKHLVWS